MYWNQRSVDSKLQPVFWERISKNIKVNYIANSSASAGSIAKRHAVEQDAIQVIYNVMDLSSSKVLKQEKNTIDIIMVANFFEEKDHFTLLKAFEKVLKLHPEQVLKLNLVGTAPGGSKRLLEVKAMAFDLGLCKKVVFHGVVSAVKSMLQQMDIGVLSTYSEGFSNAIMEYMDAGLPVVASAIGPNLEALTELNKAFLFEVEHVDELASKLEILILDENLRREIGAKNRAIAHKSFHVSNLDIKLKQLLLS